MEQFAIVHLDHIFVISRFVKELLEDILDCAACIIDSWRVAETEELLLETCIDNVGQVVQPGRLAISRKGPTRYGDSAYSKRD